MNADKDKIHLILYFINKKNEIVFYEMGNKIIDTKKNNNKKVRIIFILTHSTINPFVYLNIKKAYKKIGLIKSDIAKIINNK